MTEPETTAGAEGPPRRGARRAGAAKGGAGTRLRRAVPTLRTRVARLVWLLALLAALLLALGALLVVLHANQDNVLVSAVLGAGRALVGPFADVFTLRDQVREVLVNWGLAALAYLVVGGVLARLIRP